MSDFSIREATADDQRAILDIYNEAVIHSTATYDLEPRTWEEHRRWVGEHAPPYAVLVAVVDGVVAGWASLSPLRTKPGYRYTAEDSVYVHQDHRGRGIGGALLEGLIEAAQRGGFHSIMALIDADAAVSIRLHEKLGFGHVGRFPEVGFKFGRWLDVEHMQRMLTTDG